MAVQQETALTPQPPDIHEMLMTFLAQAAASSHKFKEVQLEENWTEEPFAQKDFERTQAAFVDVTNEAIPYANVLFASIDGTPVTYDDEVSGATVSGKLFKCESYDALTGKFMMLLTNPQLESMRGQPKMKVAFRPEELLESYRRAQEQP